jgi:outer membrane protein assembly factor BamE (lipoprotein component of BamABCDE complex)
MGVDYFLR